MTVAAVYYLHRPTPSFLTVVQAIENSGADPGFLWERWLIIPFITYDVLIISMESVYTEQKVIFPPSVCMVSDFRVTQWDEQVQQHKCTQTLWKEKRGLLASHPFQPPPPPFPSLPFPGSAPETKWGEAGDELCYGTYTHWLHLLVLTLHLRYQCIFILLSAISWLRHLFHVRFLAIGKSHCSPPHFSQKLS